MDADEAAKGSKRVLELYRFGKDNPDKTIYTDMHYFRAGEVSEALEDIRKRASLSAQTKADELLMVLLAHSGYAGG